MPGTRHRIGCSGPLLSHTARPTSHVADPGAGCVFAVAGRGRVRVRQRPLRTRPLPDPHLHRAATPYRAGHGRVRGLRGHRRSRETRASAPILPTTPDEQPPANYSPESTTCAGSGGDDTTKHEHADSTTAPDYAANQQQHDQINKYYCRTRTVSAAPRAASSGLRRLTGLSRTSRRVRRQRDRRCGGTCSGVRSRDGWCWLYVYAWVVRRHPGTRCPRRAGPARHIADRGA
jgi:hypothetical protein